MKKRYNIILIFLLSLFLVACGSPQTTPNSNNEVKEKEEVQKQEIQVSRSENTGEDYQGLQVFVETGLNDKLTYSIDIAEANSDIISTQLEDWVYSLRDAFNKKAQEAEVEASDQKSKLNSTIKVNPINEEEGFYSLYYKADQDLVDKGPEIFVKGFTFNLSQEKMYNLSDFINDENQRFSIYVKTLITNNQDISQGFNSNIFDQISKILDNYDYYIKDGIIHLIFDSGEITDESLGAIDLELDPSEISSLYTDLGKALLVYDESTVKEETSNFVKDPNKKYVALTFDDGPHPENTPRLLNILDEYGVKATFFMLGKNVDYYPEIAKDVADRGHEIGSHTYNHSDLSKLTYEDIMEELKMGDKAIKDATGKSTKWMRPPYGAYSDTVEQAIEDRGQIMINWSVDTRDWESRYPYSILEKVKDQTVDGSVILMHDIHSTTIDSVPAVIEYLQEQGFELITLSELKADEAENN